MDCQCCQKKTAHIRICDIEENTMSEQFNICADCWIFVKRYLFDAGKPLSPTSQVLEEVRGLISNKDTALAVSPPAGGLVPKEDAKSVPVCPDCGMTLAEFKSRGRFGCARDYEVFANHLETLLERVHDTTPPRHKGRRPQSAVGSGDLVHRRLEISTLRDQLQGAVTDENYELAARLRDRINQLEREPSPQSGAQA